MIRWSKDMNRICAISLTKKRRSFIFWSIFLMFPLRTEKASWIAIFDFPTFSLVSIRLGIRTFSKMMSISSLTKKDFSWPVSWSWLERTSLSFECSRRDFEVSRCGSRTDYEVSRCTECIECKESFSSISDFSSLLDLGTKKVDLRLSFPGAASPFYSWLGLIFPARCWMFFATIREDSCLLPPRELAFSAGFNLMLVV